MPLALSLPFLLSILALCGPVTAQQAHELDALPSARLECGTALGPLAVERRMAQISNPSPSQSFSGDSQEHYVVPVTVHVVRRSNGSGGLGPVAVRDTLATANLYFAPVGMEFCQVGATRFVDEDQMFDCVCGFEQEQLRGTYRVEDTLNIYFAPRLATNGSELCGLATLPGITHSGVMMRNSCAGAGGTTIVHEIGHFFDLLHTHETRFGRECADGSNCAIAGDLICDTPADPNLRSRVSPSCVYVGPTGGNCPDDTGMLAPMVENHMSYARGSCRSSFTAGQIAHMRQALLVDRPALARTQCPTYEFDPTPRITRVSTSGTGVEASTACLEPAVAAKGRFVGFVSTAPELLPPGAVPNGLPQVYVRDLVTGQVELVSAALDGGPANSFCDSPSLSANGRYVVFSSSALNLIVGTTTSTGNVYRRDRWTGELMLVTRGLDGGPANYFERVPTAISANGRYVAFESSSTNLVPGTTSRLDRIYVADLRNGSIELVSVDSAGLSMSQRSTEPAISADGRFVAFSSYGQLDPLDGDSHRDVFVHDRLAGETRLASIGARGEQAFGSAGEPVLSADGRFVAFTWAASGNWPEDLTTVWGDVVVKDMQSGEVLLASTNADGQQTARASDSPAISADGRYVAFRSEGNEFYEEPTGVMDYDVWLKDLATGAVRLVSVGGDGHDTLGAALEVALDARAETVVFSSIAANLVSPDENDVADVFVSVKPLRPATGSATRLVPGTD